MSWGFGNAAPQVSAGPDLQETATDDLGFLTLAGEKKVRLLPQPYQEGNLPPTYASLFSVASKRGLVAAAGPGALVVASTHAVRDAFIADVPDENNVKPFTPQATLSIPQVSHVAFSSDDSSLVIAAQEGGGLAIYDVEALSQGKQEPAFQMPTNGISIHALAPNPAPESAHLFAIVLTDGKFMVADLKQRQLISTANGPVFREGVTCVSWSAKGKQLVVGLQDASAVQYDPQGNVKAQIPAPPNLTSQIPMACIYWVANDDFLVIHTPPSGEDQQDSIYHLMHRDKASGAFSAQKFAVEPCPSFSLRAPAHHFISRLRKFPPSLEDIFILSSTDGTDVGVITNASEPLSKDTPIVNAYTTTTMADDTRRAQLPTSSIDPMNDTTPIGMDLDLSATENVTKPIPQEEMESSNTPLPALMILNHEGLLSGWWVVYNKAVRTNVAYPGLASVASTQPQSSVSAAQPSFAKPSLPAPANASPQPTFGSTSSFGFGGASALGAKSSPWGTPAASSTAPAQTPSAKPVFGSSTPLVSASGNTGFGAASGLARSGSVWGTPSGGDAASKPASPFAAAAPASGASGFAKFGSTPGASPFAAAASPLAKVANNEAPKSPFGSFANNQSATSPLANVASGETSKSPFASFANNAPSKSPFAGFANNQSNASPFAKAANSETSKTPFGTFGQSSGSFGSPSQPGVKASPWAAPAQKEVAASDTKEESMEDEGDDKPQEEAGKSEAEKPNAPTSVFQQPPEKPKGFSFGQPSDKPQTSPFGQSDKPAQSLFGKPSEQPAALSRQSSEKPSKLPTFGGFKLGSTFKGDESAKDDLPTPKKDGGSLFGPGFGNMLGEAAKETSQESTIPIKNEPGTEEPKLQNIPTAEQDQASKASEEPSVQPEEAPLPPDFLTFKPKQQEEDDQPPIAGSPPVDLGDEAAELSPSASDQGDDDIQGPADDESWQDDEGEDDDNEGQDDDDDDEDDESEEEEDEDEEDEDEKTIDSRQAADNTFGSRLGFPSHSTGNAQQLRSPIPSTTPAGLPKGPFFAPPTKDQESPRSPSPVRPNTTHSTGRPASRQTSQPITVPSMKGHTRNPSRPSSAQRPASPQVPEEGELSDDEDVRVREILASAVEPTKELEPFIAHQDYVGKVSKPGIGAQIERVYRDINSMLDTLGLNARSLEAFVKGHETQYKQAGRERSDLADSEDWCLVEISDLGVVQKGIDENLQSGKVDGFNDKLDELSELYKDASRLRAKTGEMRKQIGARADPQQRATHRASPLNNEAQMQQTELKEGVTKVQKLLQDAEEALSVLRADLAAIPASSSGGAGQRVPTVEAVTNTIMKMTAMVEQKSGDVDVLEAQIRRLPGGVAGLSLNDSNEDMLRSSIRSVRPLNGAGRSSSPFGTPPASRGKGPANVNPLGLSGMLGRFGGSLRKSQNTYALTYSPEDDGDFGRSSITGSAKKKMTDVRPDEVKRYQERVQQRKRILAALKDTVEKKGTRVTRVEKK